MAAIKGNVGTMSAVRKKQLLMLAALASVVLIIATVAGMLGAPKKPPPAARATETTRKAFGVSGGSVNPADVWRTQEAARVSELQQQIAEMKLKLQAREQSEVNERKRLDEAAAAKAEEDKRAEERKRIEDERRARLGPAANSLPGANAGTGQLPPVSMPPGMPGQENAGGPKPEPIKGIMRIDMSANAAAGSPASGRGAVATVRAGGNNGQSTPVAATAAADQRAETYIPPGSYMRGVLLAGFDAPTGGQSQSNPTPVVIEVLDMASLPNNFRADYKSCRLVANGDGDLSSERAYIRLDRLACITQDGGAIDVAVKGYVADQTGKAGIRGRLVTKQGQVLANALTAAVAGGIGTAFQQNAMTTSVSALGSTQNVKDGKAFQAGVGQGVNSAMQQLAKFYMNLAEKMFPIIEVDAGQPIDIIFTRGISVARKN